MGQDEASQKKLTSQQARREYMGNGPIHKVIPKMAVPTILAMLVSSIYGMADTFFVSSLGVTATGAVGINSSLDNLIMMAGSFLAVGSNSYIARLLGAHKDKKASQTLSTAFFSALIIGAAFMILGQIFMVPLVNLLGATPDNLHYTIDYAAYVLWAAPLMAASFVMNQCLRSEGNSIYSMFGMMFGGLLNIGLDPIFIFTLHMEVKGASLATAISKLVSFLILLMPYLRRHTVLHLSIRNVHFSRDIITEVSKMGAPSLFRTALSTFAAILTNNIAGGISDATLAAISVTNRIMMMPTAALLGFGQGFQPVAGYNWGAGKYRRVLKAFRFSEIAGVSAISIISLFGGIFAPQIITIFSSGNDEMLALGTLCLRLQFIAMPIHAWAIVVNMCYAGIGWAGGATLLAISRQGICFIPLVLILPYLFGATGLAASQAAADILSLFIALPLAVRVTRELKSKVKTEEAVVSVPSESVQ